MNRDRQLNAEVSQRFENRKGFGRRVYEFARIPVVTATATVVVFLYLQPGNENPARSLADQNLSASVTAQVTETPTVVQTITPAATATKEPEPVPYDGNVGKFKIDQFGVNAGIEIIGVTNNVMDSPHDPHKVGWYKDLAGKPGWDGNAVFAAHVDYYEYQGERNIKGPFHELAKMKTGDKFSVVMDNGLEYEYEVFRTHRYDEKDFNAGELIDPKDRPADAQWITLITCGGRFVATNANGSGEYLDRDVVVAKRVK